MTPVVTLSEDQQVKSLIKQEIVSTVWFWINTEIYIFDTNLFGGDAKIFMISLMIMFPVGCIWC